MNTDGYLSTEETAALLGVKVASVYLYVRRLKDFPQPVKVGRTLLFNHQALHDWRAQHPTRKRDSPSP